MKIAKQSFNKDPYICKQNWEDEIFVQCGGRGIVITDKKVSISDAREDKDSQNEIFKAMSGQESKINHYRTAFFEAFPKNPSCFIRGEGSTIEEAELKCFEKWKKIKSCDHSELDRRGREDGYAYCTKCPYSSTLLDPLTNCSTCGKPAHHAQDLKNNWYCEMHYYKLDVNEVYEQPQADDDSKFLPISDRRHYFLYKQMMKRELQKTQLDYALTHDQLAELEEIVENLFNNLISEVISKKFKGEALELKEKEIELDPLVHKVIIDKAIQIYASRTK